MLLRRLLLLLAIAMLMIVLKQKRRQPLSWESSVAFIRPLLMVMTVTMKAKILT